MRQLIAHVHVADRDGRMHHFAPGDELPTWAFDRITNPKAWTGEEDHTGEDDHGQQSAGPAPGNLATAIPPRSGAGSGLSAWAAYAQANDVDPAGAKGRDDLIAILDAVGVQTRT